MQLKKVICSKVKKALNEFIHTHVYIYINELMDFDLKVSNYELGFCCKVFK